MNTNTFFNNENKDLLYSLCRDELFRETSYDIDNNKKYYKTFGEIMKIVFKHSDNKTDLTYLNKAVLGKTIPYLKTEIEKKKLKNQPMLQPSALRNNPPRVHEDLLKNIPREELNQGHQLPVSFRAEASSMNKGTVNNNFEKMMNDRNMQQNTNKPQNIDFTIHKDEKYQDPNDLLEKNIQERNQITKQFSPQLHQDMNIVENFGNNTPQNKNLSMKITENVKKKKSEKIEIKDFKVSDKLSSQLYENNSLETDYDKLQLNDKSNETSKFDNDVDPMKLYEQYTNNRDVEDLEYKNIQQSRDDFDNSFKENESNIQAVLDNRKQNSVKEEQKFQDSLSFTMNQEMNNLNIDEIKSQLDEKVEKNLLNPPNTELLNPLNNIQSNQLIEENRLYEELKQKQFTERNYINREHLICINSGDRDWYNNTNEHRYSFVTLFNPERDGWVRVPKLDSQGRTVRINFDSTKNVYYGDIVYEERQFSGAKGCGINRDFKNVVSFELVRVLMPIENIILPFDNRIFIDYKSLPYIVLNIEEIYSLYSGTNSNITDSFAKLLWDKDHTSEVTQESITFSRQYKRGFSSMAPMSFEKKTFYPSPLSTLQKLTISLETPYGYSIKNHPDVLEVEFVKLIDLAVSSADDNYLVKASATTANTALTLNNTLIGNQPQRITIKSGSDFSGIEFLVTGTDHNGVNVTETIDGPDTTTVQSSLTYSTISSIIPSGTNSNTVEVGIEGTVNTQLTEPTGFPFSTSQYIIEITTHTYFSNRVFKIGDNIKINGFVDESSDTFDINSFINREEGHYIINLEKENSVTINNGNEGYIQKMYISPPGDIDYTAETSGDLVKSGTTTSHTSNTTYFQDNAGSGDSTEKCKIINKSLQTHFVFKIVTREEDVNSVMTSANI